MKHYFSLTFTVLFFSSLFLPFLSKSVRKNTCSGFGFKLSSNWTHSVSPDIAARWRLDVPWLSCEGEIFYWKINDARIIISWKTDEGQTLLFRVIQLRTQILQKVQYWAAWLEIEIWIYSSMIKLSEMYSHSLQPNKNTAMYTKQILPLTKKLTDAPFSRSVLTHWGLPLLQAYIKGVKPVWWNYITSILQFL